MLIVLEQVTADCLLEPNFELALAPGETLRLALEEPVAGSVYSGIGNLRGWSVASAGIDRIEIWFDGAYAFDAPYGGARGDVGNIFPDIANASSSGFSLAWNYNNMSPGEHTITARAYNQSDEFVESSSTFTVTRFHKPFFGADDEVALSGAQCCRIRQPDLVGRRRHGRPGLRYFAGLAHRGTGLPDHRDSLGRRASGSDDGNRPGLR